MNKIIQGDCIEEMRKLEPNSVDTIITDPPYGLSFMGKKWDYDVPSIDTFKEMLRVAKPGATMLCFAGTRTQHRMAVNIEDAGWILKDCIMWLYGSGFPKATDISKQLDKGHKREVVGKGKSGKTAIWQEQGGMGNFDITTPKTDQAKLWNGWKSHGLKPAYEPIIVAMKPNEGSYAQNALKHGVAGLNIDGGRIGTEDSLGRKNNVNPYGSSRTWSVSKTPPQDNRDNPPQGRFPANIILDEEAGRMLDEQSGIIKTGNIKPHINQGSSFQASKKITATFAGDKGGASRFFYVAKASKAERNLGCEELEEKQNIGVRYTTMAGDGRDNPEVKPVSGKNNHPTVKPIKLMEYLCLLTKTPTGGTVLDPFAGSGTTALACIRTGRPYIMIEKDPEYIKIIKARVKGQQTPLI